MGNICGEPQHDMFDNLVKEHFGMTKEQLEKKLLEDQEEIIIPESDYPDELEDSTDNSSYDSSKDLTEDKGKEFRDPVKFENYVKENFPDLYDQIKSNDK